MSVGNALKEARKNINKTQLQMSMEHNVSRESYSAYETERARIPKDISQRVAKETDDYGYCMAVKFDFSAGASAKKLDGPKVELHRSVVKEKTIEELAEILEGIKVISSVNKPAFASEEDKKKIKETIIQAIDAIYALEHFVAVFARDYNFGYLEAWKEQYEKLVKRGYVRR